MGRGQQIFLMRPIGLKAITHRHNPSICETDKFFDFPCAATTMPAMTWLQGKYRVYCGCGAHNTGPLLENSGPKGLRHEIPSTP
jgi:hypothetical protein